jgi:hypothetical protein
MKYLLATALLLAGCTVGPPPLKPGTVVLSETGGLFVQQSENPATPTVIEISRPDNVSYPSEGETLDGNSYPDGINLGKISIDRGYVIKVVLGAAQEDLSREIAAKLSSMKPVQYAGIGLIVLGMVAFFIVRNAWPTNAFIILIGSAGAGGAMIALSVWMPQINPWAGLGLLGLLTFVPVIAYVYYKVRNDHIENPLLSIPK